VTNRILSSGLRALAWCFVLGSLSIGQVACGKKGESAAPQVSTTLVQRGAIEVTASADGVVEPVRKVEVKSKASGEITALTADTGDIVTQGQVLVQLLPRDAQNSHDQASADLDSARARLQNAEAQLRRQRRLFDDGLISASEIELDELAVTTAKSELVRAQKVLDNAAERLSETTVRSPINGTVIAKSVEVGQVVSSAVSQVSGGTLLLTLADLNEVQVRSLVDEVDIGKLRPGMSVALRVEAFADRRFEGTIQKIEPQAVVEQNVTMFPVITRIDNREGLLKPGMNAEMTVMIERRDQALQVPNEAVKGLEDAFQVAALMGLGGGGEGGGAERGGQRGPGGEGRPGGGGPPGGGAAGSGTDRRVVFVQKDDGSFERILVEVGLRNWETTEILGGLTEGQKVALLPSASQLRQSAEFRERMQRMRAMPGMGGGAGSSSGGGRPRSGS
jgi:HlyD family secretion protein